MLSLDTQKQLNWQSEDAKAKSAEKRIKELQEHIKSHTITVEDDAGKDISDVLARLGKPLASQHVIDKLTKCNPRLVFERSKAYPSMFGIYLSEWERNAAGGWELKKKHICGMEAGIMPELSVIHKKRIKVPNKELIGNAKPTKDTDWIEVDTFADETRGWRTVLVRLLHMHLITEADVHKHFGWNPSIETQRWKEKLA